MWPRGWPQVHYITKGGLKSLILLPLPQVPHVVYVVLGSVHILDKHSSQPPTRVHPTDCSL